MKHRHIFRCLLVWVPFGTCYAYSKPPEHSNLDPRATRQTSTTTGLDGEGRAPALGVCSSSFRPRQRRGAIHRFSGPQVEVFFRHFCHMSMLLLLTYEDSVLLVDLERCRWPGEADQERGCIKCDPLSSSATMILCIGVVNGFGVTRWRWQAFRFWCFYEHDKFVRAASGRVEILGHLGGGGRGPLEVYSHEGLTCRCRRRRRDSGSSSLGALSCASSRRRW